MKRTIHDVDNYIAAAPQWARATLKELRCAIQAAAPKAKESISYHMPYYSQNGRLAYFAAHTSHCSFHWISGADKKAFAKDLRSANVVGNTLRIPRGTIAPAGLIQKIVKARVKANEARKK
jgi:uncharacterized protein YdhG (YjbR/CyaY superfamily)